MAHAKLMKALKKDDDDAPRPALPPSEPTSDMGTLKLKKSTLTGAASWDGLLEKLDVNSKHDFETMQATLEKMLKNVLNAPAEPKYRKINKSNPNFTAKVYSCKGAPELFQLVGFKETIEAGFLVLPEGADLALLQRALDTLSASAAARQETEAKKRKLEADAAARARAARAEKAREAAEPSQYDAAVAGASSQQGLMADEDEVMVDAIGDWFDAHPEVKQGRAFDAYAIERQVAGPGNTVVASVAASVGTSYFDFLATMKRGEGGNWTVSKIVAAEG